MFGKGMSGAEITCATSFDERFDPKNVLNTDNSQMWITTGMYPQEITITFTASRIVKEVKYVSTGIRKVHIKGCTKLSGNGFNTIGESTEITNSNGAL